MREPLDANLMISVFEGAWQSGLFRLRVCFNFLVPFTRNFTTYGATGRQGIIQTFIVPHTGVYLIKAWGARGGTHSTNYIWIFSWNVLWW